MDDDEFFVRLGAALLCEAGYAAKPWKLNTLYYVRVDGRLVPAATIRRVCCAHELDDPRSLTRVKRDLALIVEAKPSHGRRVHQFTNPYTYK